MEDRPQTTSSTDTCKIGSMEDRPQTTSSAGTCKLELPFPTHSNDMASQSHREWAAFQGPVVYTGPNGKRHHKVAVSSDLTSQMSYLSRPPPGAKFPKAKNGQIGEIGWLYDTFHIVKGM